MDDDDDDFGDLYADVLQPISAPPHPPPPIPSSSSAPNSIANPLSDDDDDQILYVSPRPAAAAAAAVAADDDDWLLGTAPAAADQPESWDDDEGVTPPSSLPPTGEPRVLEDEFKDQSRVPDGDNIDTPDTETPQIPKDTGDSLLGGGTGAAAERIEICDPYEEPEIPGLSVGPPVVNTGNQRASRSDDWDSDSDSEDDLRIVLNEANPTVQLGGGDDDDEDGDDFVILTGADQLINQQPMEEQDWGEETMQPAAEGEHKEGLESGKGNGVVGISGASRIGYNNHGFNPQHHSMYKYVRPGAGSVPGAPIVGSVGGYSQVRPSPTLGPIAGRGRGDWRPSGGRGVWLPAWANNSSGRAFGSGLDFTLPSHKTAFDIDIESFDDKPWRHPGVDISVYFNFGLDEDNWKDYCKRLEQFRLETTMQSKIRVYESGRSEQDFDPELPPELAAAAGHYDSSADNPHHIKVENGQADLGGHGRGAGFIQAPLPTGRAIQVEVGCGERLPSIDTRQPRMRDPDVIIEIVLQGSLDNSTTSHDALKQSEKKLQRGDLKGNDDFEEDNRQTDSGYFDRFQHTSDGRRRELPDQYNPNSKRRSSGSIGGPFGTDNGRRLRGASHGRNSNLSRESSVDTISAQNAHVNRRDNHKLGKPGGSTEHDQNSEGSPAQAVSTPRETILKERGDEHNDRLVLGDSIEAEGEDTASDFRMSGESPVDDGVAHSVKKQKMSSQVDQPQMRDNEDGNELRTTPGDNGRAKSASIKDYQKRREDGEEVIQDGRSRRFGDLKRQYGEEDRSFRKKDDYVRDSRHDMDINRVASRGRENMNHSYPHRDWDSNSAHHVRGRSEVFERPKEMDARQRIEEDVHSRRVKDEDTRRGRNEETGTRNRNKFKVGDRNDRDDDAHLKRRADDGEWRVRHREGGPRQRVRDDLLMKRRENLDDPLAKRTKDEHSRGERADKENALNASRTREDSSRRKRERNDGVDQRREDDSRMRNKVEDHHSAKHKDDSWRQREREDRQRLKQLHEDPLPRRERIEGRSVARNGRATEDHPVARSGKNRDDPKGMISDKDNQHRERRRHSEPRHSEPLKRTDRSGQGNDSHHRREDVLPREKQSNNEEKSSRHERLGSSTDRPSNASESRQIHRGKGRESTRKSKDVDVTTQNPMVSGKRKYEGQDVHRNEKVVLKGTSEQESNSPTTLSKMGNHHVAGEQDPTKLHAAGELGEDPTSDDEKNQRGRSKLERWTSQKERDYSTIDEIQPLPSSLRAKEVEGSISETVQADECRKDEGNNANDSDTKGVDAGQIGDRVGDDRGHHLDTVAKLKMRSERFKLPMPGEKDMTVSKKVENEQPLTQNETASDLEIKPERPARKRRWTGS